MNKEEAKKMEMVIGKITIPEKAKSWCRFVRSNGDVVAMPFVNNKLTDEERAEREAKAKIRHEAYVKRLQESKKRKAEKLAEQIKKAEERKAKKQAELEALKG